MARIAKLTLPESDVQEPPLVCFEVNEKWATILKNTVDYLENRWAWKDGTDTKRAKEQALILEQLFQDAESCEVDNCTQFFPWAGFVEFSPNNPYTEPDLIPDGYIKPPWYVVSDPEIITQLQGFRLGDVGTDITSPVSGLPNILPASGLPRVRVNVKDAVRVRVELANIRLGGMALVTIDHSVDSAYLADLLLTLIVPGANQGVIDVNMDVLSYPFETDDNAIVEHQFTTAGDHFIEITMLPKINDELPFLYFGGGVRSIEICGASEYGMEVRRNPEDPSVIEQLEPDGSWRLIGRFMPNEHDNIASGVEASGRLHHNASSIVSGELLRLSHGGVNIPTQFYDNVARLPQLQINGHPSPEANLQMQGATSSSLSTHAYIRSGWANSIHATRRGRLDFNIYGATGVNRALRLEYRDTDAAAIGFLGAAAIARQILTGDIDSSGYAIAQALANFGLVTNSMNLVVPAPIDNVMTDVTLAGSNLNIWRWDGVSIPVIFRQIDLLPLISSLLESWCLAWSFETSAEFLSDLDLEIGSVEFADDWIIATENVFGQDTVGEIRLVFASTEAFFVKDILAGYITESIEPDVDENTCTIQVKLNGSAVDSEFAELSVVGSNVISWTSQQPVQCDEIVVIFNYSFDTISQTNPETRHTSLTVYGTGSIPDNQEATDCS